MPRTSSWFGCGAVSLVLCLTVIASLAVDTVSCTAAASTASADTDPGIAAAEEWLETMRLRYERNPELRDQPGSGWKPYNRVKWLVDQRRVDGKMAHPISRWRAWEEKRARESRGDAMNDTGWFQLGPTRMSGRIIDIEFHPFDPTIVYVGAASGGLWKSTDGGDTWRVLTDELPNLAIGGIAVLPENPDIVLIGTGEATGVSIFGLGIFKSTDGGETWSPTDLTRPPGSTTGFHVLEVNPLTGTILAGSNLGLYRSTDQGDTWTNVHVLDWTDIKWKPGDPSRVYGAQQYRGVNVSTDDGVTWTPFGVGTGQPPGSDVGKTKIAISPEHPEVIYAHYAHQQTRESIGVYRSTDEGNTWEVRNNTTNMLGQQGNYNLSLIVDPDNVDRLVSGGVLLYGSYDGGVTWTVLNPGPAIGSETNPHVDNHAITYEPGSTSNLWIGTDGGVWRSTDDGETWRSRREGLVTYQFYDICVSQSEPMFMMGGTQDNGVPGREGVDTWFQTTLYADGMVCNITPTDASEVYAEWQFGRHVKSFTGGQVWHNIQNGIGELGPWVTPVDQDQNDPNRLFTSSNSRIYRTINGASLWEPVTAPGDAATWLSISPIDADLVWSLRQSGVRYTTDGGETWQDAAPFGFEHDAVIRMLADPVDPDVAFVTFGGYSDRPHIAMTLDRGQSWVDVTGDLPDMPVNAIVIDPDDPAAWFIATDVGVWWTTDGGEHWLPFGTELPNVLTLDVEIQRSARKLVAGSYGRGAWEIDLQGPTEVVEASSLDVTRRLMLDPPIANPATTRTSFRFAAHSDRPVSLVVYDVAGQRVHEVVSLPRGDGIVRIANWDAAQVASGIYFVTLRSGSDRLTRSLVVVR